MTQKELADKIGVHNNTVICWESGKSVPKLAEIIKISRVLSVSIDYLCGETDIAVRNSYYGEKALTKVVDYLLLFGGADTCKVCANGRGGKCIRDKPSLRDCRNGMAKFYYEGE